MKTKKHKRGPAGLTGTPEAHEESAERYLRTASGALRERRPCAALRQAHYAEVELHYVQGRPRDLYDRLAYTLDLASRGCGCAKDER
jgi:hypothetical protein